jgi:hypothetical protein
MPLPLIKSFSKKAHKPKKEVERLWDKSKKLANKQGIKNNYAYRVGILKKSLSMESLQEDLRSFVEGKTKNKKELLKGKVQKAYEILKKAGDINYNISSGERIRF